VFQIYYRELREWAEFNGVTALEVIEGRIVRIGHWPFREYVVLDRHTASDGDRLFELFGCDTLREAKAFVRGMAFCKV
jgi:hypothetical protein